MARHESGPGLPLDADHIAQFIRDFEACTLPKALWTHQAHLLLGLWYLSNFPLAEALPLVRKRIRAYNEVVGTANTDSSGYHETLTRFYLQGIAAHVARHHEKSLPESLALLLETPLAHSEWPLAYYSRGRLFSVLARRQWVAPDVQQVAQDND